SLSLFVSFFIFFSCNAPPPPAIYPLSLHDALPICERRRPDGARRPDGGSGWRERIGQDHTRPGRAQAPPQRGRHPLRGRDTFGRSEEHTSELQSRENLVCRLLLEKKKKKI